jgi:2Fe-2S ferredoxin
MCRIVIINLGEKILEVTDKSKTLLQHFHDHHLDWMHACGAKGRCTTCKAVIIKGAENIEPLTQAEETYRQQGALNQHERLTCQAKINGEVHILVPVECKLPHMKYSD